MVVFISGGGGFIPGGVGYGSFMPFGGSGSNASSPTSFWQSLATFMSRFLGGGGGAEKRGSDGGNEKSKGNIEGVKKNGIS